MLRTTLRPLAGAAALALLAGLAAPAAADDEKKIRVKKIHRLCDGEDCDHAERHRAVFIGEDGELTELGELAGDAVWMEAGEHGLHVLGGKSTFLGVQLTELTDELRAHFGVPEGRGVLVSKVVDGSPAALAGVRVGDVITAVDGETVASGGGLGRLVRGRDDGETIALELYRDGVIETLSPTLAERELQPRLRMDRLHGKHGAMDLHLPGLEGMDQIHQIHQIHQIMVRCEEEDGEKDCDVTMGAGEAVALGDFDCGGADECLVEVECGDDGCECTANGDAVDCDELPGLHGEPGE